MKAWEVPQYDCQHCGAIDSTNCEKLPVLPRLLPGVSRFEYASSELDQARAVGCRVACYHDLAVEDRREQ